MLVNEYIHGGLLEFLGHVQLSEESFDQKAERGRLRAGAADELLAKTSAADSEAAKPQAVAAMRYKVVKKCQSRAGFGMDSDKVTQGFPASSRRAV